MTGSTSTPIPSASTAKATAAVAKASVWDIEPMSPGGQTGHPSASCGRSLSGAAPVRRETASRAHKRPAMNWIFRFGTARSSAAGRAKPAGQRSGAASPGS